MEPEEHFFRNYINRLHTSIRQKKIHKWFLAIFSALVLGWFSWTAAEYYFYKKVNFKGIKSDVIRFINQYLERAADLGVLEYRLFRGYIFNDILISLTDDFSSEEFMLKAGNVTLVPNSYFTFNPYITKVRISDAEVILDVDDPLWSRVFNNVKKTEFPEMLIEVKRLVIVKNGKQLYRINNYSATILRTDDRVTIHLEPEKSFAGSIEIVYNGSDESVRVEVEESGVTHGQIKGALSEFYNVIPKKGKFNLQSSMKYHEGKWSGKGKITSDQVLLNRAGLPAMELNGLVHSFDVDGKSYKGEFAAAGILLKVEKDAEDVYSYRFNAEQMEQFFGEESLLSGGKVAAEGRIFEKRGELVVNGRLDIQQLALHYEGIDLLVQKIDGEVGDAGKLSLSGLVSAGKDVFQIQLQGSGGVNILKKRDGEIYYQLYSSLATEINADRLTVDEYMPWIENRKKAALDQIRVDDTKLLPREYVVYSPVYRQIIERTELKGKISIKNVYWKEIGLGPAQIILNSNRNLFYSYGDNPYGSYMFRFTYDNLKPVLQLQATLSAFPLQDNFMEFCGSNLNAGFMNLDYALTSQGNNLMELYHSAGEKTIVSLRNGNLPGLNYNFDELSWEANSYDGSGYLAYMSLRGDGYIMNGYGRFDRYGREWNLNGLRKGDKVAIKLNERNSQCEIH